MKTLPSRQFSLHTDCGEGNRSGKALPVRKKCTYNVNAWRHRQRGDQTRVTGNATLKWDAENRLIGADYADGKKVGSGITTRYIYGGWNIIVE